MNNKIPKIQLATLLTSVAYFSTTGTGFSAFYGGVISLVNTALINNHIDKQKNNTAIITPQASVGMMVISVIMRIVTLVSLMLIGRFILELSADALIISLVLGLIGFLIDRFLQK